MLREHYRCHPKIIGFCNKCFYNDELIILSENTNDNPIKQYKCVPGNHARCDSDNSQFNDRQAEVIIQEEIPNEKIDIHNDSIGIITPYKAQKKHLIKKFNCSNVSIDTVHGFQGRENDVIIFSTVANWVTKFLDNPNSINVAVSRAIKKLILVTPFAYKSDNSNISSLINYISYNNFEIVQSNINSVFDLLYRVNNSKKNSFLLQNKIVSIFFSENLMYSTIKKVLSLEEYQNLQVTETPYPLRCLVKDTSVLTQEEIKFIKTNSHVDFLIFNKFDKRPVLAIEVDGYKFHSKKEQIVRDQKKNKILDKCEIPLIRFRSNECDEDERLKEKLEELMNK